MKFATIRMLAGCGVWLTATSALAAGIGFFTGSFEQALSEAQATDRQVFVDVYTEWCAPCKIMDRTVFPDDRVGDYFNSRFVSVKIDAEDEVIDGPLIANTYEVGSYPTLLFLHADGSEIGRIAAGVDVDTFLKLASGIIGAVKSDLAVVRKRYESGDREPSFVREFLEAERLAASQQRASPVEEWARRERMMAVFDGWFESSDKERLVNAADFGIILAYKGKAPRGDSAVEFVIANYDAFARVAGEYPVSDFVLDSNAATAMSLANAGDEAWVAQLDLLDGELRRAAEFIREVDPDSFLLREYLEWMLRFAYLSAVQDWAALRRIVEVRLAETETGPDRIKTLVYASRSLMRADDSELRAAAYGYARRAYEIDASNPAAALAWAHALNTSGAGDEALALLETLLKSLDKSDQHYTYKEALASTVESLRNPPRK